MDTISLSKTNRLFWLGRYNERVYTTLQYMCSNYDKILDDSAFPYDSCCLKLGIPNGYDSAEAFCSGYLFDPQNPSSVINTMTYTYDNAVVLRDAIGTQTLSYVEMACSAMNKAKNSETPMVELQWVLDDLMAFRGSCDDTMYGTDCHNIILCGTYTERVDLYLRLDKPKRVLQKELDKLIDCMRGCPLKYQQSFYDGICILRMKEELTERDRVSLITYVEGLFNVE